MLGCWGHFDVDGFVLIVVTAIFIATYVGGDGHDDVDVDWWCGGSIDSYRTLNKCRMECLFFWAVTRVAVDFNRFYYWYVSNSALIMVSLIT